MTQTTGPHVAANDTMNPARHASVTIAAGSPAESGVGSSSEDRPRMVRLATMPTRPNRSMGFRPTRSMILMAITVMTTFRVPITRLA